MVFREWRKMRPGNHAGVRLYEGDPEQNLDRVYTEKARPAVVHHPVTERKILLVNPLHTHGFQGMAKDEAGKPCGRQALRGRPRAEPRPGVHRKGAAGGGSSSRD